MQVAFFRREPPARNGAAIQFSSFPPEFAEFTAEILELRPANAETTDKEWSIQRTTWFLVVTGVAFWLVAWGLFEIL